MTKEAQDFEIRQGEDATLEYFVTDSSTALPLNMTGFSFIWELNAAPEDDVHTKRLTEADAALTLNNGDGTNDMVRVALVGADTRALQAGIYHHELRIQGGALDPEQVAAVGNLRLRHSPTRADNPA